MKDLDFLPDWYKDRRKRHSRMRRQYIALAAVFLMMMTFNLTATHRAARVAANVSRHEEQRMNADAIVHEFNRITKELNQMKTKAGLVHQIDTRFDVAAILAEVSHIVDESVVLSKLDLIAEPLGRGEDNGKPKGGTVKAAGKGADTQKDTPLGNAKLRIVLAGVATHLKPVTDLVCRLEESSYFQEVRPSFYGKTKIPGDPAAPGQPHVGGGQAKPSELLDVTEFEITCYLANYTETKRQ